MPGTGKKKSAPAKVEVDGKVFGTGTMMVDGWDVTLLVDPASVDMINTREKLEITSGKGGSVDPIYGDFLFMMRPKKPGETPRTLMVEHLRSLNIQRDPLLLKGIMASFDVQALQDQTSSNGYIGVIKIAEAGKCVYELWLIAPDIDQLVKLELASRAGILSRVGKTPMPAVCK